MKNGKMAATLGLAALSLSGMCQAQVTVTVDKSMKAGTSQLRLGLTHTQKNWNKGEATASANATTLLKNNLRIQNQHIMGWGTGNPEPAPGQYDFASLDARVNLMRSLGGEMAITFCSAPGWMKVNGKDWDMNDRIAEEHNADFAELCKVIALRYPDVKWFDIWNEMKGYWNDPIAYTKLYNTVYTAVRAARPDAKIGGCYPSLLGDASVTRGYTGQDTQTPLTERDNKSIDYWLANKVGADFIAIDRWLVGWSNKNPLTEADQLALTWTYGQVIEKIKAKTDLPIWYAEYYTWRRNTGGTQFIACAMASIDYWIIKGAGDTPVTALLWNPSSGEGDVNDYLFTATDGPNGGQPTPHYPVFKGISEYFAPGTPLYKTTSSDPDIEVLASATKTMLINKHNSVQTITINGKPHELPAYAVQFIDTP